MKTYVICIYSNMDGSMQSFQGEYFSPEHAAETVLIAEGFEPDRNKTLDEYEQFAFDQDHAICVHEVLVSSYPGVFK